VKRVALEMEVTAEACVFDDIFVSHYVLKTEYGNLN
jgi:hypothetical protein